MSGKRDVWHCLAMEGQGEGWASIQEQVSVQSIHFDGDTANTSLITLCKDCHIVASRSCVTQDRGLIPVASRVEYKAVCPLAHQGGNPKHVSRHGFQFLDNYGLFVLGMKGTLSVLQPYK